MECRMAANDYDDSTFLQFPWGIKTNDPVRARAKAFGWGEGLKIAQSAKNVLSLNICHLFVVWRSNLS